MTVSLIDLNKWSGDLNAAIEKFDCGISEINFYLRKFAEDKDQQATSRVILLADDNDIFGFASFSIDTIKIVSVEKANYPILKIDAIGIDRNHKGNGFGTQLLLSAFRISLNIHQTLPIDGIFLVALRDAVEFYEKFDIKNLNAPPEWVMNQMEFQMGMTIDDILALGVEPYSDVASLR
ncbi:GNAT family N-acetyltransferase [Streptococcus dysgalactiae]|uniref:GNAT family N-acetyltransferase n=1 Tax=Streptococcus dysgalactiae TaxID=1334 RepID=UPI0003B059BA|nr:GNAT family N-acetyltransferase [Streptococcus dysgalactiae]OCW99979.1 hypothetical protein BBG07_09945 [Streptococcus dysgalactiae subsp. equisimilis]QBX14331.1 hypothetical protein Javan133_0056 [Streptococcus phage Javan133]BAN93675.1 acetyltransferase [Streptococcus dysgalactiae subsp. equisimilis 167]